MENAALRRRHDAMRLFLEEGDREAMSLEMFMIWRLKAAQLEVALDRQGTRLALAERALRALLDGKDATEEVRAWRQAA